MNAPKPPEFEKMGAFYLGRVRDVDAAKTTDELVLLDSRDLTTHAVCVGMTGSGKTGLCIALLEEAAIDGVPAIAIDPKGDLSNLLLTFPGLSGSEFLPWIDESEASREGRTLAEQAEAVATKWREGLASWGEDGERIARLRASADFVVYTPGSAAARPIAVLRSFAAPPAEIVDDPDALRERVSSTASSLLALAGVESDPLRGREHVLLATILEGAWREGRDMDLAGLIGEIRTPRFQTMGVVDVESFYPEKARFDLAMTLNALAASPGFAAWMAGDPLDVASMLRAPDGRPRVSIVSIAHLSDPERMFFVTLLLQEIIGWMRRQPGTASLRALLFMDEVFGFLPPTANPPSKLPMLTLLKQARAHGLGVVLATQNPVDLDYKALSNTGTWMLGRLQTERDKMRVLDGLEGAAATGGRALDRQHMDALLSGLGKRMFVLGSAHEDVPIVFESRWAMSYLRGPLTRSQLTKLAKPEAGGSASAPTPASRGAAPSPAAGAGDRPLLPPGISEIFISPAGPAAGAGVVFRLRLLARARLHHVSAKDGVDAWRDLAFLADVPSAAAGGDWGEADALPVVGLADMPVEGARFEPPSVSLTPTLVGSWTKAFAQHLHASAPLTLLRCDVLDATSKPGESEADFRGRLAHEARERRDIEVVNLRKKHAAKFQRLEERIRKAEQKVEVQRDQASHQRTSAMLSVGGAVLGALFGRRGSALGKATTVAKGFGRASQEKEDVQRAQADVEAARVELARLEEEIAAGVQEIGAALDPTTLVLDELSLPPRKSDLACSIAACWTPWTTGPDGLLRPAW